MPRVTSALALVLALLPAGSYGQDRQPRIANGVLTNAQPSTGALLINGFQGCSGTMVGCRTFLTAAHCVCSSDGGSCDPNEAAYQVFLQHAGIFAVSQITPHPGYSTATLEHDVAVVVLAASSDGVPPTPMASTPPPFGTPGTIVGFGTLSDSPQTGSGIKRQGAIVTADCQLELGPEADNSQLVCWDFDTPAGPPGTDSNTCPGDSGGPLFTEQGGATVLAGVTSFGIGPCAVDDFSGDTNVATYAAWVSGIAGGDAANTSCGALAQVGRPGVEVDGFEGNLSGTGDEAVHSFTVPVGTSELRVIQNGLDDGTSDFDLAVRFGSPPSEIARDCASASATQFEVCTFSDPSPGTWYAMAESWQGSGAYQITTTAFADATCGDGTVEPGETCDDGNALPGDGCDDLCQIEPVCGNGSTEGSESCDDGNTTPGDGCDAGCELEPAVCGDGVVQVPEGCDDANTLAGDGCDASCELEPLCGDGVVESPEQCDDGNRQGGDGCNATCQTEFAVGGCPVLPDETCEPPMADGSKLKLKRGRTPEKNKLRWTWKAVPLGATDFGDPLSDTDYRLCLYDEVAGVPSLALESAAPAGPLWSASSKGLTFKGSGGPGQLKRLKVKAGSKLKLAAKGKGIALPGLPVSQDRSVRLQLRNDLGSCWEALYEAPASRSDASQFVDRSTP
jgi:cysteine-rich repeat protein